MKNDDDFIFGLRQSLDQYRGLGNAYILLLPDYVQLLADLLDVDFLDSTDRRDICTALGYFIAPNDLIPESIYGPQGYVDDLYLCGFVLQRLIARHGSKQLDPFWQGEDELAPSLNFAMEKAGKELDEKGLRNAVLEYVGMGESN